MKVQDLYEQTTNTIIKQLEEGVPPWVKPWVDKSKNVDALFPANLATNRPYSGINILLLWQHAAERGFSSMRYCTFDQAQKLGAKVRKGEKAAHVIFTKRIEKEEENGEKVAQTVARAYTVFNLEQLENVPDSLAELKPRAVSRQLAHRYCIAALEATKATVLHGGNQAAYYAISDQIVMPRFEQFESEDEYWGTMWHEVTHWTAHPSRLDRKLGRKHGPEVYGHEELIAELGSAFLCAKCGIKPTFRSASYIQGWLNLMKADKRAVFSAASYASQSATYVMDMWTGLYIEPPTVEEVEAQDELVPF